MGVKLLELFVFVVGLLGGWSLGYLMGVDTYINKVALRRSHFRYGGNVNGCTSRVWREIRRFEG
jgi:hypothetical protein